jgi:beta-phosphoglucomutase-like phosphatase (HAD superfamily)
VVEDSVNGVRAGVAAGMQVWGFTGGGHGDPGLGRRLTEAGAAAVFTGFADMPHP